MYTDEACCIVAQDETLEDQMEMKVEYLFGTDNCFENIKVFSQCATMLIIMQTIMCGWMCDPNTEDFIQYSAKDQWDIYNLTVWVDEDTAQGLYDSCADRCVDFAGRMLVSVILILALFG